MSESENIDNQVIEKLKENERYLAIEHLDALLPGTSELIRFYCRALINSEMVNTARSKGIMQLLDRRVFAKIPTAERRSFRVAVDGYMDSYKYLEAINEMLVNIIASTDKSEKIVKRVPIDYVEVLRELLVFLWKEMSLLQDKQFKASMDLYGTSTRARGE